MESNKINESLFWIFFCLGVIYSLYLNAPLVIILGISYLFTIAISNIAIHIDETEIEDLLDKTDISDLSDIIKAYMFNIVIFILIATTLFNTFYNKI